MGGVYRRPFVSDFTGDAHHPDPPPAAVTCRGSGRVIADAAAIDERRISNGNGDVSISRGQWFCGGSHRNCQ
jgi:hypothetical protein